ncbi:hypothetical protein GCM10007103_29020 [Salinimicrobium marinum]|uniref:Membrane protein involved in the export of O-antigen and teichoic acid n=1 Tax=Salinimicrobium marinum TaxID=680283 RepID=A0A918W0Q1_9FLAO|nr:oligosaccharide flippase family protein [Salinimicrobium marinum]GHA46136.1 hypothetical protein GCM10007103_29020 [Salinimicrobium marinum]
MKDSHSSQAFWVVIASLSSVSIAIVSAAILSRYFGKEEYGTYKQIIYVYNTLLVIFTAGLPKVFGYYLPRFNLSQGKSVVKKINRFLFLTGFLFSASLYFAAPVISRLLKNPELTEGLQLFSLVPVMLVPTLGIEGIFAAYRKTRFIALYNTLSRLLMLICIVVPVIFFNGGIMAAVYGWVCASFITLTLALFFKQIPFKNITPEKADISSKEIFAYSFPIALASLWGILIKAADQFYISRYFGAGTFAEFSNGFIELPLVGMVTSATSVVLMPVFSKIVHEEGNKKEMIRVWKSALYKSAILIYPFVIFFLFFANEIMILLYSEAYKGSGIYFQVNMFLNIFNIILFAPLLFAMGKTRFYARMHMWLALVIWVAGYFVIQWFNSPVAIAILSVALAIFKINIFLYFIAKFLGIKVRDLVPVRSIMRILAHTTLCILSVYFALSFFSWNSIIMKVLAHGILYGMLLLLSSSLFRLNYIQFAKPLLQKFSK